MTDGPAVNERIAARRAEVRAERRRSRLRRTITTVVVLAVVVGAVALERSPLVALATFEVTGTERVSAAQVRAASGVGVGTSVLRIRADRVRDRIESLPLVERAEVERDGALGLVVTVTEVSPALTAVYGDGQVLVDDAGLVLGEGTAPGTPRVRLPRRSPPAGSTTADDPALALAHTVLLGLPGPLAALVDEATVTGAGELELVLDDRTTVRWGDATRADEKARALGAVLDDLGSTSVTVVDVRAPAAPTVTP